VKDVQAEVEYCRSWCNDLKVSQEAGKTGNPKIVLTEA
jgi:hypothetical protein